MSTVENPLETPVVENPFVETPFTDVGAEVQRAAADPPPPIYAAMAGFAEPDELLAAVREVRAPRLHANRHPDALSGSRDG